MDDAKSFDLAPSQFVSQLDPTNIVDTPIEVFDLDTDDSDIVRICNNQLKEDTSFWEQAPYLLSQTDKENIAYILGDQKDSWVANPATQTPYVDNRLFASVRSILSYASGQPAKPELQPSKSDEKYLHMARQLQQGLYQHVLDHDVNDLMRLSLKNLITRKRGVLKLRYDSNYGPFGDVCTDNVDPADIVVGRFSKYGKQPDKVYQRQKASIQKLCEKFPDKKQDIFDFYGFKRGVPSQTSRVVTYWECWFDTYDAQGNEVSAVCWFIPNSSLVLGKMKNPNWVYKGSDKNQRMINMTDKPIKPYVFLNYWNTGRSFIDETCLLDQARPQQDILNKRGRQIVENADYANPRILANGGLWDEGDAKKFVNKSAKTIGLLNNMEPDANINNAVMVIQPSSLPSYVIEDKLDARGEIDAMMGTPTQFRGQDAGSKAPTLGQDLLVKQQAAALQDDLVVAVNRGWTKYYLYLIQMMNTYLPDDYYVMSKGKDGEYNHILLNQDTIDTNVRVSVQVDSTLPLDKQSLRATAMQLAQINRIDDESLFEFLGMPNPDKLAERKIRWEIDRIGYLDSIKTEILSQEAEMDIRLIINGKIPEDRDDYDEDYLNHWNLWLTKNEAQLLKVRQPVIYNKLTTYLQVVADKAALTQGMMDSMLDPSGMTEAPLNPPLPKVDVRILGSLTPEQSAQKAALPPPPPGSPPPSSSGGSPAAPQGQPSQPRMVNPSQFGAR